MKTCILTMSCLMITSTVAAQLLQPPTADPPAAENDEPAAGDQPGGPPARGNRRARGGADRQADRGGANVLRGPMGPMANPMFEAIDVDSDGVITRAELRRAITQLRTLDTDEDGNISLAEASPQFGPGGPMGPGGPGGAWGGDAAQMVERFLQSDANGDGKLTADELPGPMAQQMIRSGDKDGDGALSKDELTQAIQEMQNRFRNGPGGFPGGPGNFQGGQGAFQGGPAGANAGGQNQIVGQMLQYDRNGDGRLSANEVPPQAMGMLRGGDQNGDGQIDAAELRILAERFGDRMRALPGRGQNGRGAGADNDANKDDERPGRRPARGE